jgi:hypothetical protein
MRSKGDEGISESQVLNDKIDALTMPWFDAIQRFYPIEGLRDE